jgi:5-methylcytosine-specific restriction endonuclease McrA
MARKLDQDAVYRAARRRKRVVLTRTCEACSVVFQTVYGQKRFCEPMCGKRHSEKGRERKRAERKMRALRSRLWARDSRCYLCGFEIDYALPYPYPFSPQIDHVFPLSMGGRTEMDNLAVTHKQCNEDKADRDAAWWERRALAEIRSVAA